MSAKDILKLIVAMSVSLGAGFVGSLYTMPAIEGWYAELVKPALDPPDWVFGPVWTALYILMGAAAFLVWSQYGRTPDAAEKRRIRIALELFVIQLCLNALWSVIFFGMQSPSWALAEMVVLWLAILATIIAFAKAAPPGSLNTRLLKRGRIAAWLLVPYILWVTFAAYLNLSIWILN